MNSVSTSLQIPHTIELYLLDISVQEGRQKLREQFYKNSHIRDPRVIDMLVIKVQANSPQKGLRFVRLSHFAYNFSRILEV